MFLLGEIMRIVNDGLEPIAAVRAKKRLEKELGGEDLVVVDVGSIAIPRSVWDELNALGVWVTLERAGKFHRKLRAMRLV